MIFGKIHRNSEGRKCFCYVVIDLEQKGKRIVVNSDPVREIEIFKLIV